MAVEVGEEAPSFRLQGVSPDGNIEPYTLEELTDEKGLVMSIYAHDFSPRCESQLCSMDDVNWLTVSEHLNVVGISGDGPYAHKRFIDEQALSYPLLSDTSEEVIAEYGVLNEEKDGLRNVPQRSLFLVGPDRRVRYRWVADDNWDEWDMTPLENMHEHIAEIEQMG